jgi:adenylosuccinate lyase
VGKISGAVGNYANVDPQVEQITMSILDLGSEPVSTQIVQRDRHAEFMTALALLATTIEKIALQVRHYQRTEVLEAEEYFAPGQKGSSAMPHKRNPIISERLCGQARVIRGNMLAALENVALWHERDISHSSAERIILPDSTILLHYMLKKACWLVDKLNVYPENMAANMEKSFGLLYSQRVLLALVEAGMLRDDAYAVVQRSAMKAWEEKTSFLELLKADPEVTARLSAAELETCFNPGSQLQNMGVIFERISALDW